MRKTEITALFALGLVLVGLTLMTSKNRAQRRLGRQLEGEGEDLFFDDLV